MSQIFKAATQYNDFVGSAAADRSDNLSLLDLLKKRNLFREGEIVVGFEIVFNENSSSPVPSPGIVLFLGPGGTVEDVAKQRDGDGVFQLRSVEIFDITLADFFAYFKRFNVMLANKSVGLSGQPYRAFD